MFGGRKRGCQKLKRKILTSTNLHLRQDDYNIIVAQGFVSAALTRVQVQQSSDSWS